MKSTKPYKFVFLFFCVLLFQIDLKASENTDTASKFDQEISYIHRSIKETESFLNNPITFESTYDLLFKLSELYVKKSRLMYFKELEKNPNSNKFLSGASASEIELFKKNAIDIYDRMLNDFPNNPKNKIVLFLKAHEYRELGLWDKMKDTLYTLIKQYSYEKEANEARIILANYFLDRDRIQEAEEHLRAVLNTSNEHMHPDALYKMALIEKDRKNYKNSLSILESLLKKYDFPIYENIRKECLNTVASFYSEVLSHSQFKDYFYTRSDDKNAYTEALYKLAYHYSTKEKIKEKADVLREIIRFSNDWKRNLENSIECYNISITLPKEKNEWILSAAEDAYNIIYSFQKFKSSQNKKDSSIINTENELEERSRDLITRLDTYIKSTKDTSLSEGLIKAYDAYVSFFTSHDYFYTMKKNYAYALYENNQFIKAALLFSETGFDPKKSMYEKNLIQMSIQAYHNAFLKHFKSIQDNNKDFVLTSLDFLQGKEMSLYLYNFLSEKWPEDSFNQYALMVVSEIFYIAHEYERSFSLFESFLKKYPKSIHLQKVVSLMYDILDKQNNFSKLTSLANSIYKNSFIIDESVKKEAQRISSSASEKDITYTLLNSPGSNYADAMKMQYEKHKGTQEGEEYLWKGFVKYTKEQNNALVIDLGTKLIAAYPDSSKIPDVMIHMALSSTRSMDYERSAFLYEDFYNKFPKHPSSYDYLKNAVSLYFYLDQPEKSLSILKDLIENGSRDQRIESYEKIFEWFYQTNDLTTLDKYANDGLQDYHEWPSALYYKGYIHLKQKNDSEASAFFKRCISGKSVSEKDEFYIQKASAYNIDIESRFFASIEHANGRFDEAVFQKKVNTLLRIEKTYNALLASKNPENIVFSFYGLGFIYDHFSSFLKNSPLPEGLDQESAEQYKASLNEQAEEYKNKAENMWSSCTKKSLSLHVFTEKTSLCNKVDLFEKMPLFENNKPFPNTGLLFEKSLPLHASIASNNNNVDAMYELALLYAQNNTWSAVELVCFSILEKDNTFYKAHNLLGKALFRKHLYSDAEEHFLESLKYQHKNAALNAAYLYELFGFKDDANKYRSMSEKWKKTNIDADLLNPTDNTHD